MFLMLTVFYLGSTIKDLPFSAWGAELSSNYNERTLIMSWREGLGTVGSLDIRLATPLIASCSSAEVKPADAVFCACARPCASLMPIINLNCLVGVPGVARRSKWRNASA